MGTVEPIVDRMWLHYETSHAEILDTFGNFVFHYDAQEKSQAEKAADIKNMLELRLGRDSRYKRRSPKIFLLGPPGCGRSTQAAEISKMFGVVNISVQQLASEEAKKNPAVNERVRQFIEKGAEIPDDISLRLVRDRITQPDCRVNGFIIDGFP